MNLEVYYIFVVVKPLLNLFLNNIKVGS